MPTAQCTSLVIFPYLVKIPLTVPFVNSCQHFVTVCVFLTFLIIQIDRRQLTRSGGHTLTLAAIIKVTVSSEDQTSLLEKGSILTKSWMENNEITLHIYCRWTDICQRWERATQQLGRAVKKKSESER